MGPSQNGGVAQYRAILMGINDDQFLVGNVVPNFQTNPCSLCWYHTHQCLLQLKDHTSGSNHVQSPPDFGRPISLKHLYVLMMTSCCFLAPVASVFANKNVKLLCFWVFFEWPHRESFMISWRKQWHQGFGPRRHILRSGQTWKRLHAAHELILGRLIQLCWEAQWPKNWPANSSNEKHINISIAQWVWSWSWFPIWIHPQLLRPKAWIQAARSSSPSPSWATRQWAVGRVLVASNMEILRQRISANPWNIGASTSSKTLRDRTTGNSRDWTIEYGYRLLLNMIIAYKLCAAQGTAQLVMMGPACLGTAGHSRAQPGTAAQCFCDEKTSLVLRAMLEIMVQLKMIFYRRKMTIEMTETNHGNICHGFSSKREGWRLITPRLDLFEQRSPSFQPSEMILFFV